MIDLFFKNPNVKKTPSIQQYQPAVVRNGDAYVAGVMGNGQTWNFNKAGSVRHGIDVAEFVRRDTLVRTAAAPMIALLVGDRVAPSKQADMEKYGVCRITDITRSYADFPKGELLDEKQPIYVVSAFCEKTEEPIVATGNFFNPQRVLG